MKAADALGLLAGLGALSALRGGREGTGKRFAGLMDMLDGGGAGASGDRFEGGGLLSVLGNLFAKPLEAQDNIERIARDTNAITQRDRMSAAMADEVRRRGLLQDALDPRGVSQMRPMAPVGSGRGTMGMPMQGSGRVRWICLCRQVLLLVLVEARWVSMFRYRVLAEEQWACLCKALVEAIWGCRQHQWQMLILCQPHQFNHINLILSLCLLLKKMLRF